MISDDFEGDIQDDTLKDFDTFEQYLDFHITEDDMFYLEDRELARLINHYFIIL